MIMGKEVSMKAEMEMEMWLIDHFTSLKLWEDGILGFDDICVVCFLSFSYTMMLKSLISRSEDLGIVCAIMENLLNSSLYIEIN
jgi:hypothetical protein